MTPEEQSRRDRKKAQTRDHLIEAATKLFWERGYEATGVRDITEEADVAFRTFYLHFNSKADVAIARFEEWIQAMTGALSARPLSESPPQMLAAALDEMTERGYAGDIRLRDLEGKPLPPIPFAVLLADTSPEVAGRMYQTLIAGHQRMTKVFTSRLGYPDGSIEPRIVAASFFASLVVTIYGYADLIARDPDPPPSNHLARRAFGFYMTGVEQLVDTAPARQDPDREPGPE